jgi:hypothetical protein
MHLLVGVTSLRGEGGLCRLFPLETSGSFGIQLLCMQVGNSYVGLQSHWLRFSGGLLYILTRCCWRWRALYIILFLLLCYSHHFEVLGGHCEVLYPGLNKELCTGVTARDHIFESSGRTNGCILVCPWSLSLWPFLCYSSEALYYSLYSLININDHWFPIGTSPSLQQDFAVLPWFLPNATSHIWDYFYFLPCL